MMMDQGGYVRSPYLDFDPSLFAHSDEPEYVFPHEKTKRRGWGERMFSSIGYSYLSGITIGGMWGFTEGLRNSSGTSLKLRWNGILNGCTRRGPYLANSLGVVALMYGCTNAALEKGTGWEDDWRTSGTAAVVTGVMYRCAHGPRAIGLGALVGGALAGAYYAGDTFWNARGQSWSEAKPNWS